MNDSEFEYAGFWVRFWATMVDSLILLAVSLPLLIPFYDSLSVNVLVSWVLPAAWAVWFWSKKGASPGKMALSLQVLDARTGDIPTLKQSIGRYLAYFVAMLPFFLGIFWVIFDARKQGWHDKLAGTVVVRKRAAVVFAK
jgi:uncharacterized RDD family membrane protein YckC